MARHRPQLSVLRRSRQSPWRRWAQRGADLWNAALGLPALWLVLFLLAGTWCVMPSGFLFAPRARAGAIADQDYVAPRDLLLLDEESSRAKEARAREAVPAVYDFDPEIQADRDRRLEALFRRGRELAGKGSEAPVGARLEAITAELAGPEPPPDGLRLTPAEVEVLARKRFSADLEDRLHGLLDQTLRRGVVANKGMLLESRIRGISLRNLTTRVEQIQFDLFNHLGYPEEARDYLQSEVRAWTGLTVADRRLLAEVLFDNLPVNLHFNQSETRSRRDAVAAAAGQVFTQVRKGQVIVRKGDQISATAARVISQIRGDRHLTHQLPPIAGTLFLVALAALALWLGLRRERVADHPPARVFGEMLMLLTLALLGARFCFMVASALSASGPPPFSSFVSYAYAVPFASLSLLAALLLTRNAALVLAFFFPLLASRMVDSEGLWVVFYGCAGSLAAVFALDQYQFKQRLVMTRVGLVVGAVNMLLVVILETLAGGLADRGLAQVSFDLCCAFAGGLLVTAVASFMVPILESALGITTDIKLVELSNTNLPLLRRLAFEAPGTFQHSLMVANLAKEGCEAI
ncbi:MAG TPA: hypothetical protein VOA87_21525, partial [Thermoanaerobaculia bacterium]|nr:hypothetical protein [Thermoanaerobaculia bacterium]